MAHRSSKWSLRDVLLMTTVLIATTMGAEVLQTSGFNDCGGDASIKVDKLNISYDNGNKTVTFDVAGSSAKEQNVTATLNITAYGKSVFSKSFNPCDSDTFVAQLCPVPVGSFGASGAQQIPPQFANMVPAIAFKIPDIAAQATLQLESLDSGEKVACIQSQVSNGKSVDTPVVSYVAASVAGAALVLTGASAAGAALSGGSAALAGGGSGAGGVGSISPSFIEVAGWFQGMAMNGMLSVNYPPIYRNFAKNFAFSTGLVPWTGLMTAIDNFRAKTGGNLANDSVEFLQKASLVLPDGSTIKSSNGLFGLKRAVDIISDLTGGDIQTSINTTSPDASGNPGTPGDLKHTVHGIQAFVEQLRVPKSNVFMTALLIIAIAIAAIVLGILLFKVILELWAVFGNFPPSLVGFREHYWHSIARTIITLILLLYGVWVLYCVFQFTRGDSWAAKALAGVTLAIFTGILGFFSWKIWAVARRLNTVDGDTDKLYEDKAIWVKYSMFYEAYRKDYWWVFVPIIVYMLVKGSVLAAADGHGMVQTVTLLIVEAIMLILLLWIRPYERRSGNIINTVIAVVRVLSMICILIFVEEFGIAESTQTVTGIVMIAIQSTLTAVLAILIAWNAINACCKMNPHRKRRKEMGMFYRTVQKKE